MKIRITEEHIRKGFRGSCASDAVCLAMRDAGLLRPWVSPTRICWADEKHKNYSVDTPSGVYAFLQLYDNNHEVYPFEFELEGT